ncbi:MAG: DUF721 domain-containing protein [Thermoleophilia bacterium]|nr:DUF721 domain-containing protein [Thermoleophilia bacterium]
MPPEKKRWKRRRRDAFAAGDLLGSYLERAPERRDMASAWERAAPRFAGVSVPIRASRAGVVTIACADASVAQEVAARADRLAEALQKEAGVPVRGLRAVIADHALPGAAPAPKGPPEPPGDAARAAAAGLAANFEDEQVRAAIERAAAADLQRRWSR